jgi:hypothetical protein
MIKQLLILVGAAATAAGVIAAVTWPGEAQQRSAYVLQKDTPPVFDQSYTAGMRIIHVPQARASASNGNQTVSPSYSEEDDDAGIAVAPKPRKQVTTPQPRRVLPPANGAKRTVLTAPDALHDGPSPIRPLPHWHESEKVSGAPASD